MIMGSKELMEKYVLALEQLFDKAKASALGAASVVLQALHKSVLQAKGNVKEIEDSATKAKRIYSPKKEKKMPIRHC
ncbi:hypothetical protein R1flu_018280 [Riccia fluitans]|uniref:Uncharacterized protein n=1 Tax=Riccia fluitans TaxID=41844 RepID=A0ABD1ZGE6_9MARC